MLMPEEWVHSSVTILGTVALVKLGLVFVRYWLHHDNSMLVLLND